jgi:hypothetical protein
MFTMTYNKAIQIQESQLAFYLRGELETMKEKVLQEIKGKTLPCPFDPNEERPVIEINRLVPRGGDIETALYGPGYGQNYD